MIKFWQWTGLPERNGLIKSGEVGITMSLFPAPPNSQDISIKILIQCWDYIQFFRQNWMKLESFAICLKVSPPPKIYLQPKVFIFNVYPMTLLKTEQWTLVTVKKSFNKCEGKNDLVIDNLDTFAKDRHGGSIRKLVWILPGLFFPILPLLFFWVWRWGIFYPFCYEPLVL